MCTLQLALQSLTACVEIHCTDSIMTRTCIYVCVGYYNIATCTCTCCYSIVVHPYASRASEMLDFLGSGRYVPSISCRLG